MSVHKGIVIGPAGLEIYKQYYGDAFRWRSEIKHVFYAEVDGEIVGIAGVWRDPATAASIFDEVCGRWIAFFDVKPAARAYGREIVLAARAFLKNFNDSIYVHHDDRFPEASRLLLLLGFTPIDELAPNPYKRGEKLRIWKKLRIEKDGGNNAGTVRYRDGAASGRAHPAGEIRASGHGAASA